MKFENKLITCIVPVGSGHTILEALKDHKGVTSAFVHHARGAGMAGRKRKGAQIEKDMVTVAVTGDSADEIFSFIFFTGGLNQPHGGFMWMERAARIFTSPPLPENVENPQEDD